MTEEQKKLNRELDALVAEKVMGLDVVAKDWPCGYSPDCGEYEASSRQNDPSDAELHDTKDYVYLTESGKRKGAWPPKIIVLDRKSYAACFDTQFEEYQREETERGPFCRYVRPVPFYSSQHDDAATVEATIAAKGLQKEYTRALLHQVGIDIAEFEPGHEQEFITVWAGVEGLWKLATATPEERCWAAIEAVIGFPWGEEVTPAVNDIELKNEG